MSKRKNLFLEEYCKQFNGVKRSFKGECFAHCSVCNCDINLECIGKDAVSAHIETRKHKKSAQTLQLNQSMKTFFKSQSAPTADDHNAAAAEGTWAFHMVKHSSHFFLTLVRQICLKRCSQTQVSPRNSRLQEPKLQT